MINRFFTHVGHVRTDDFGRVIVDPCASDQEHLTLTAPLPEGQDRHRCRKLVESAFDEIIGKKGRLVVTIEFQEDSDD